MAVICTLYEGNYHYGLGALVNSLHALGFRGHFYAGYRGDLPPWAQDQVRRNGIGWLFDVEPGITLHFVPIQTPLHFNNYKPHFMLDLMEEYCPDETKFYFFDPDIVVKAPWSFFEQWTDHGIALCEDVNHYLPRNHPVRMAWRKYATERGLTVQQSIDKFYNGGFLGVPRQAADFLRAWKKLFECRATDGVDLAKFELSGFEPPYLFLDQDLMNLALMFVPNPISAVGPEGMDFTPGGYVMSHSAGDTKSWRKRFLLEAIKGRAPSRTDKEFIRYTQAPIRIYSAPQLAARRAGVLVGSAIGRFYRRSTA
jgi:hypothetical protein